MAGEVLDISVDGTDARGLAAAEFPSRYHPQEVLKYALTQDDLNARKSQKASTEALRKLQELKVSGWRNHVDSIAKQKQDILNASVDYFRQNPKATNFNDYDPYDEKQSTAARNLQEKINQYQADEQLSNQVKAWAQKMETAINSKEAKNKYTQESIDEFTRVAALPFEKFKEEYEKNGRELPELEPRYDYFTDGWKVAKSIGTHLNELELNGRKITNKAAVDQYITGSIESFLGGSPSGQQYVKKMQESGMTLDEIVEDFKEKYVKDHLSTTYKNVLSGVGTSEAKKQLAKDWQVEGNSVSNDKNIWSVFRKDDGSIEVTPRHTDAADNRPLTFEVGGESITGTPVRIEQPKEGSPYLLISVPKGNEYKMVKDRIVSAGKDADIVKLAYNEFADIIKGEFGNISYYDVLEKVKSKVGSTGTGGGKTETKSSGGAKEFKTQYSRNGANVSLSELRKSYTDEEISEFIDSGLLK